MPVPVRARPSLVGWLVVDEAAMLFTSVNEPDASPPRVGPTPPTVDPSSNFTRLENVPLALCPVLVPKAELGFRHGVRVARASAFTEDGEKRPEIIPRQSFIRFGEPGAVVVFDVEHPFEPRILGRLGDTHPDAADDDEEDCAHRRDYERSSRKPTSTMVLNRRRRFRRRAVVLNRHRLRRRRHFGVHGRVRQFYKYLQQRQQNSSPDNVHESCLVVEGGGGDSLCFVSVDSSFEWGHDGHKSRTVHENARSATGKPHG